MSNYNTVSVAVTRYNEKDELVIEVLRSLSAQEGVSAEVLFFDQKRSDVIKEKINSLKNNLIDFKYISIPAKSLSYARNLAVHQSMSDIILFIDTDAIADPRWAVELASVFSFSKVGIVGGKILPYWHSPPLFVAKSHWVWEQYSLFDQGDGVTPINKIVGASFAIHRGRLDDEAYFDENLGRREGSLLGGEESDLCRRSSNAGWQIYYNGSAVVKHQILPERISYKWLLKRVFYAGYSRALLGGGGEPAHAFGVWDYVILPFLAPIYFAGKYLGKRDSS